MKEAIILFLKIYKRFIPLIYEGSGLPDLPKGSYTLETNDTPPVGLVQEISFEGIQRSVKNIASIRANRSFDLEFGPPEFAEERAKSYWHLVSKIIRIPRDRCFEFIPESASEFDHPSAAWQFYFVLLHEEAKKGLVISGYCIN